jgi:hypothetical protein
MTTHSILNPFVPCSAPIFLDEQHKTNTYCQREIGHTGKHNIENKEPAEEKTA